MHTHTQAWQKTCHLTPGHVHEMHVLCMYKRSGGAERGARVRHRARRRGDYAAAKNSGKIGKKERNDGDPLTTQRKPAILSILRIFPLVSIAQPARRSPCKFPVLYREPGGAGAVMFQLNEFNGEKDLISLVRSESRGHIRPLQNVYSEALRMTFSARLFR
jgi:hypothetical protein